MTDDKKIGDLLALVRKLTNDYGEVFLRIADEIEGIKKDIKDIKEMK